MAIKLPKDIIESGYRFESGFPQPVIETEKELDGSFKVFAKYDASLINDFVKDMARDMNEKLSAELIDELLRLNGYVPERTCELELSKRGKRRCKRCGAFVSIDAVWDCYSIIPTRYCPNCGAKVVSK